MNSWPPLDLENRPPLGTLERMLTDTILHYRIAHPNALNNATTRQRIWEKAIEDDVFESEPPDITEMMPPGLDQEIITEWDRANPDSPQGRDLLVCFLARHRFEVQRQLRSGRPPPRTYLTTASAIRGYFLQCLWRLKSWEKSQAEIRLYRAREDLVEAHLLHHRSRDLYEKYLRIHNTEVAHLTHIRRSVSDGCNLGITLEELDNSLEVHNREIANLTAARRVAEAEEASLTLQLNNMLEDAERTFQELQTEIA